MSVSVNMVEYVITKICNTMICNDLFLLFKVFQTSSVTFKPPIPEICVALSPVVLLQWPAFWFVQSSTRSLNWTNKRKK